METEAIDWTMFRKRISINKPFDDIYKAWATKSQIEQWFLEKADYYDTISFTFGAGGNVHIQLNERNEATEVILTQDNIPTDDKSKKEFFVGCSTGWAFWLANLKAWLEHRITLHAKGLSQEETTDLVNS